MRITPRARRSVDLRELWNYRELLYFFVWRDIKVRYKQTMLGAAWAMIQPLMTMIVLSVFFGRLAKVPSDGVPYPVFALCGLLVWQLFAFALTESSNSLVNNANLVTKTYFPRLLVPLGSVVASLVDFCIAFVLLIAMMVHYHIPMRYTVALVPLLIVFALMTSLAVGLWLSALNVQYRDVRHILPFLAQFWMVATPVAYPASLVPEKWRFVLGLNPMAGVVEAFRWAMLGTGHGAGRMIATSAAVVVILLIGGVFYFRNMETTFADLV